MSAKNLAELKRPLPVYHPKAWWFGLQRIALRAAAPFSKGIETGFRHGFDSGVMLDYVYRNKAQGLTPLGQVIDRVYLNAPGWAGIRNRGSLIRRTIVDELVRISAVKSRPIRITDLACGGGQYVLEALAETRELSIEARLRDYEEANIKTAKENAKEFALEPIIEKGDAFSDEDLFNLGTQDLIIVSGLHEIIDDDEKIKNHFNQINRHLAFGGRLILTIQPDHPQVEFIAKVLKSHTGEPWAMRLRSKALVRKWLNDAGFRTVSLEMEKKGIFGVILAEKIWKAAA